VHPQRSQGGQRLYSDADVSRLLRLRELTEVGRPISMVAALPDEEAIALLHEDRSSAAKETAQPGGGSTDAWVEQAYVLAQKLDGDGLGATLRRAAATLGAGTFLGRVATPFLARLGEGWMAGEITPAQEHFSSGILEGVLTSMVPTGGIRGAPAIVVATLPGERHGLGARLVATAAVIEGWNVTYLGTDLPEAEIASAADAVNADAVALSLVSRDSMGHTQGSLVTLRSLVEPRREILVGGRAAGLLDAASLPTGIRVLHDLDELRRVLRARM
jgi:hypothetical protein